MEQLRPPPGGHGDPRGELVAWGDVADRRARPDQCLDGQAVLVHRQAAAGHAVVFQHPLGAGVAGVFHRRRTGQQRGQQPQQVFQSSSHHDLFRAAPHAPVLFEVAGQRPPQFEIALRVAVGQQLRRGIEQLLLEPRPCSEREERRVHPPRGEIIADGPLQLGRRGQRGRGGGQGLRPDGQGQILLYIKTAALPRFQIPFRRQKLIRGVHRVDRHRQFRRQPPLAGHPSARRDGPGAHFLRKAIVELFVQRHRRGRIQRCCQVEHKTPPLFGQSPKLTP